MKTKRYDLLLNLTAMVSSQNEGAKLTAVLLTFFTPNPLKGALLASELSPLQGVGGKETE